MRELCLVDFHWTPVRMVAKWLQSLCPQHAGLTFEIVIVRHKSSIQNDNLMCWRTENCPTNAWTMFYRNSLDATKHGCKSATQPMFRKRSPVFQPAGSVSANAQLKPSRQPPKPNPSIQHHTRKYQPAKRTANHMQPRRQQWNTHLATVRGSTQSTPHKRQWKTR